MLHVSVRVIDGEALGPGEPRRSSHEEDPQGAHRQPGPRLPEERRPFQPTGVISKTDDPRRSRAVERSREHVASKGGGWTPASSCARARLT